jgi:hypothetical protein
LSLLIALLFSSFAITYFPPFTLEAVQISKTPSLASKFEVLNSLLPLHSQLCDKISCTALGLSYEEKANQMAFTTYETSLELNPNDPIKIILRLQNLLEP